MANVLVNDASLADIADAIREKNGTEETYKPAEMGDAVRAIESGGGDSETILKQFIERETLEEFIIPSGVKHIGHSAFRGWLNLKNIVFNEEIEGIYNGGLSFLRMTQTELPNSIKILADAALQGAEFKNKLLKLPNSLETIGNQCFQYCLGVNIKEIPQAVTTIGKQAFQNCAELTELTFKGTPTSIANNAFQTCNNLLDIYVPWAEGAVSSAPWGATNATIHYNTVYDENHEPIV